MSFIVFVIIDHDWWSMITKTLKIIGALFDKLCLAAWAYRQHETMLLLSNFFIFLLLLFRRTAVVTASDFFISRLCAQFNFPTTKLFHTYICKQNTIKNLRTYVRSSLGDDPNINCWNQHTYVPTKRNKWGTIKEYNRIEIIYSSELIRLIYVHT